MRVFYTDDSETMDEVGKRLFYVKIDNITLNNVDNTTRTIMASSGGELLDEIIKIFGFDESRKEQIQIWTNRLGNGVGVRIDNMEKIPKEYEFIYVRGISNTNNNTK